MKMVGTCRLDPCCAKLVEKHPLLDTGYLASMTCTVEVDDMPWMQTDLLMGVPVFDILDEKFWGRVTTRLSLETLVMHGPL